MCPAHEPEKDIYNTMSSTDKQRVQEYSALIDQADDVIKAALAKKAQANAQTLTIEISQLCQYIHGLKESQITELMVHRMKSIHDEINNILNNR